jgi:hypothetical protein
LIWPAAGREQIAFGAVAGAPRRAQVAPARDERFGVVTLLIKCRRCRRHVCAVRWLPTTNINITDNDHPSA